MQISGHSGLAIGRWASYRRYTMNDVVSDAEDSKSKEFAHL